MSSFEFIVAVLAVFAGATLQGSLGFGLGLVAAPVLVLIDPTLIPGVILGMGVPLTILVAIRERHAVSFTRVKRAVVGRALGTVVGSAIVYVADQNSLSIGFAIALLLAVGASVGGFSVQPTPRTMLVAGFGSGLMGTTTSVGGPPIALVLQHQEGPELRASIGAFMAIGASLSLGALIIVGEFRSRELVMTALLVVPALLGFVLSHWTNRVLDRGYTRGAVLVFAAASAVSILLRQLV